MEIRPEDHSQEAIGTNVPENENQDSTLMSSVLGNRVVQTAMRALALGGAGIGFLGAPSAVEARGVDDQMVQPTALTAGPHHTTGKHHEHRSSSHTGPQHVESTPIVDFPKGYFFGTAYSTSRIVKLGESNPSGFSYGMLIVNGVYKCGWIKDGIVPRERGPHKSAGYCQQYYKPLTFNAHAYLKDLNCDPGDCQDGTPTKEDSDCKPEAFANFTTSDRSVFNVYPTGKSGLVEPVGAQTGKIYYRATVKQSSDQGFAAVVRGQKGWNLMFQTCVPTPLLISSHSTNNSPSIKLGNSLQPPLAPLLSSSDPTPTQL
ncbi:MAG: hypothetical protein ACHQT9_02585 [Candidatus Saccharimonadales bacterium]